MKEEFQATVYATQTFRITVPIEAETIDEAERMARALTVDQVGMSEYCEDACEGVFNDHIISSVSAAAFPYEAVDIDKPIILSGTPNYHALFTAAQQACADPRCPPGIRAALKLALGDLK